MGNHGDTEGKEENRKKGSDSAAEFPEEIDELSYEVIGAGIEVHRELGPGFLESVYEDALEVEFRRREIPFERQFDFALDYKGHDVGRGQIDFLVDRRFVVELKAVDAFAPIHTAQVISYLKATNCRYGLLMNFNEPVLHKGLKRVVWEE